MRDRLEAVLAGLLDDEGDGRRSRKVEQVRGTVRSVVPEAIRRRYALKFGIVLFVLGTAIALIGIGATVQFSGQVKGDVDAEFETAASQQASQLEAWNARNKRITRMIARTDVVQNGSASHVSDNLFRLSNDLPKGTAEVHYVDADADEIVASTNGSATGLALSGLEVPWIGTLDSGMAGVQATDGYRSPNANGAAVLAYVTAVPGQTDRFVVYTVRLNSYGRFLSSEGSNGVTAVVDGRGQVLFEDSNSGLLSPYADGTSSVVEAGRERGMGGATTVLEAPAGFLDDRDSLAGGSVLVGFAAVPGTDWVMLVHAPTSEAYGFANAIRLWGSLATILGVVLIAVVGAVLGRNTAVAIDRLTAKTERMEAGDLDVDLATERVDNVGRLYDGFASMRDALREQIAESQSARREAEQARQEAEATAERLQQRADEYSAVMEAVGAGDLTRRMATDSENEAMAEIAREFNAMIDELEATVAEVTAFATEVATASEEVTAATEEVHGASEQVTSSVNEIVDGADRQSEQLDDVTAELNSLSTTIEEIASSADQVADSAERTAETGEQGREAAEAAIAEMTDVEAEADGTVDAMEQLSERIERIEEITEFITDVAEQTNILALNANIEAARAGEAGEGFAVVADEVKSLAEETREAAAEIEGVVDDISDQTERTAREVRETSDAVAASTDTVREAIDALEEIADYAAETNSGVQEISEATADQATSTNEVVSTVEAVADIAAETSDEANTVAGAAEEQTSALTEMTTNVEGLSERAGRLSAMLDRFDTGDRPDVDAGTTGEGDTTSEEDTAGEDGVTAREDGATGDGGLPFDADGGSAGE